MKSRKAGRRSRRSMRIFSSLGRVAARVADGLFTLAVLSYCYFLIPWWSALLHVALTSLSIYLTVKLWTDADFREVTGRRKDFGGLFSSGWVSVHFIYFCSAVGLYKLSMHFWG